MDYKKTNAPTNTITRNMMDLCEDTGNVYETVAIIGKRANQIGQEMKNDLSKKLQEFASYNDNLEEVFENREQIEISRYYEKLPKPTLIATQEYLEGKVYHRNPAKEKEKLQSELLNRQWRNKAVSDTYEPGSTFKTVTALAAMEHYPDWQNFTVECTGEMDFQDKVIHCYNNRAHGTVDMKAALAASCNCYFAALAKEVGAGDLAKTMRQVGMDQSSHFELETSGNSIYLDATEFLL